MHQAVVLARGLVPVDVGAHLGVDALDRRLAQHPAAVFDRVAAHVQQHAAARSLHVPEPGHVGAVVLLGLLDQERLAHGALVDQRLGPHVFGGEQQLLGVEQVHPRLLAGGDHLVGLLQRAAQRLLAHDVLAGAGRGDGHLGVLVVGQRQRDQLDVVAGQQLPVVLVGVRDPALVGERLGLARRGRGHGQQVGLGTTRSAWACRSAMKPLPMMPYPTLSMPVCLQRSGAPGQESS